MLIDLVTVEFQHRSGLKRDNPVNGFVFASEADLALGDLIAIETKLTAFFNTNVTGTSVNVAQFMSSAISRTVAPIFRHYNLDGHLNGSAHGSPVRTNPMALLAAPTSGSVNLPSEVAACMSFSADYGTDAEFSPTARPRSRDRGRVFIGPLNTSAIDEDITTKRAHLISSFKDTLGGAGARLMNAHSTDASAWVVWSRKNAAVKDVTSIQVDDAFDTQRRRGERPLVRSTYTV